MELALQSLEQTLADLDRLAPNAPLLALGQTVFWDEPMKAGVALAAKRKFVAGVHDTDYFAKLPGIPHPSAEAGLKFVAVPHNDTKTRGLWSAAAEFSALFGSESVVTRDTFLKHGLRLEKVLPGRPTILDEASEAFGWRGVVAIADETPVTAEVPLDAVYPAIAETLRWAIDRTLASVSEPDRLLARDRADVLVRMLDAARAGAPTLAELYRRILPDIYAFVAGERIAFESTRTTELLQFNTATADRPRFELVDAFLRPETSEIARRAYDEAIAGSEMYGLDRFMSGAIPFDLVIPGRGRGTVRIARRAIVIMTPKPQFVTLKKPVQSVQDLAEAIEGKFGTGCTLIGKAVTLIGMLAREHVFVFHEGASSYVKHSRKLHQLLRQAGLDVKAHPILRVRYRAWDALSKCHSWLKLPEPLVAPFGAEEICGPSFAARWREVGEEQRELLGSLKTLRRPMDLVQFLEHHAGSSWKCLAKEYQGLYERLRLLEHEVAALKDERRKLYGHLAELKRRRVAAEVRKGEHWRAKIFEQTPSRTDMAERDLLAKAVEHEVHEIAQTKQRIRELLTRQRDVARDPEVQAIHDRRRAIEREAELKRLRLIRSAIIATKGLESANLRPAAWWFPVVCSDGGWFKETVATAETYLEPLT